MGTTKEYALVIRRPNIDSQATFFRHHDRALVERRLIEEREHYRTSEPTAEVVMVERAVGDWIVVES